jgi:membrane AbrB-like protein
VIDERAPSGPGGHGRFAGHGKPLARLGLLFLLATLAGAAFQWLGSPLPWMIGPLVVTAFLCISRLLVVSVPNRIRPFGQVIVACQVGLTFTPSAFEKLLLHAPVIVGTAVASLVCIFAVAAIFAKVSGLTFAQAFLSAVPTSPIEAAAMAVESKVDPMPVIFSQTVRLSAVVVIVPFAMYALEGWPESRGMGNTPQAFDFLDIAVLALVGLSGMALFRLLRVPNPNFLGPLTLTALLAATGHGISPFPFLVLSAAQIVLGSWLGSTFRRDILTAAGRLTFACVLAVLVLLALCAAIAVAMSHLSGMDWRLVVLGAAPGGVVEMALTAKYLHQDVTIVTAFHLTRIFLFMPNIPWIVALINRYERRNALKRGEKP